MADTQTQHLKLWKPESGDTTWFTDLNEGVYENADLVLNQLNRGNGLESGGVVTTGTATLTISWTTLTNVYLNGSAIATVTSGTSQSLSAATTNFNYIYLPSSASTTVEISATKPQNEYVLLAIAHCTTAAVTFIADTRNLINRYPGTVEETFRINNDLPGAIIKSSASATMTIRTSGDSAMATLKAGDIHAEGFDLYLGDGAATGTNSCIIAENDMATPGQLRYNRASQIWEISNTGAFTAIGTGSGSGDSRWTAGAGSPTYTGSATFNITGDQTAIYKAGYPVRFKVTGSTAAYSYGVIVEAGTATITIGGDAITAAFTNIDVGVPELVKEIKLFLAGNLATADDTAAPCDLNFTGEFVHMNAYLVETGTATVSIMSRIGANDILSSSLDITAGAHWNKTTTNIQNTSVADSMTAATLLKLDIDAAGGGTAGDLTVSYLFVLT